MRDFSNLDDIAKQMAQRDYLIKKRKQLVVSLTALSQEEIRLQSELKKETHEYRSIEKLSIKKLLSLFSDKYEEMMDKEYREMKIAEYKYERLLETIKSQQEQLRHITELLTHYEDVENQYAEMLETKRIWASQNGFDVIADFEHSLLIQNRKLKELDEALSACKKLIMSLSSAKDDLASAKNWGIFDILGGGLIPSLVKHDHIKRASQYIKDSSEKAAILSRELRDLSVFFSIEQIEIDSLSKTFDTFFDNIFSDMSIQEQINTAYENICHNYETARILFEKLETYRKEILEELSKITKERNELIHSL